MKGLMLVLCVALTVDAEVAATSTAEQLGTLASLLQEHHHRFTRQVTTPPPPTPTPTNDSVVPTSRLNEPACQIALGSFVQSCFWAHGLSIEDLSASNGSSDSLVLNVRLLTRIYCSDGNCQSALLDYYQKCFEEEVLSLARLSFQAMCSINNNGIFCYDVYFNSLGNPSQILQPILNVTVFSSCFFGGCTKECLALLTDVSKFGCCTNEYLRVIEEFNLGITIPIHNVWDICGLQNPGFCNGTNTTAMPPTSSVPSTSTASVTMGPSISTTFVTPTTPTPPTISPKSRCAKRAKDFSADQACSGGANVAEILTNQSAQLDTARISRLHSNFCSSQSCFNKYVKTYSACIIDMSAAGRNASAKKSAVQQVYKVLVPLTRKVYCGKKDGQFCIIRFPEIQNLIFATTLRPCLGLPPNATCSTDCCNAVRTTAEKYGCCFRERLDLFPIREPCLRSRVWKKCGIPNPGKCNTVLKKPRRRLRN